MALPEGWVVPPRPGRAAARWLALCAACGACLLSVGTAEAVGLPTIYDNAQGYALGSRAAALAGAYTALGCDEGAVYYNPAALACAPASRLELSANGYLIQGLAIPDAFGSSEDIAATNFHVIPTISGGAFVLIDPDEDGAGELTLGFNVAAPVSLALKIDPAHPARPNFVSGRVRDDLTVADVGIAYQAHSTFAFGVALGGGLRTYEAAIHSLLVSSVPAPCLLGQCFGFLASDEEEEALAVGMHARIGLRFTPIPEFALGITATSPTIDLYGSASVTQVSSAGLTITDGFGNTGPVYGATPIRLHGESDLGLPGRLALGVAYLGDVVTVSADFALNFSHHVRIAHDLEAENIAGVPPPVHASELSYARDLQPNVNIGVQGIVDDGIAVAGGFFTDLSAVSDEDIAQYAVERVHMFGASFGVGMLGTQSHGWYGLSFEYGAGDARVISGALDLDTAFARGGLTFDGTSSISRWTLAGFVGTSYSFLPDEVIDRAAELDKSPKP